MMHIYKYQNYKKIYISRETKDQKFFNFIYAYVLV